MITLVSFWKGRDTAYSQFLTDKLRKNAVTTVNTVNQLIQIYTSDTGKQLDEVSSGWRPPAVNDATANAAKDSPHLTCEAVDILDSSRDFAIWCLSNLSILDRLGLYMEDPRWTYSDKGNHWVHLQTRRPRSGKRVFIPATSLPRGPSLPGQKVVPHAIIV